MIGINCDAAVTDLHIVVSNGASVFKPGVAIRRDLNGLVAEVSKLGMRMRGKQQRKGQKSCKTAHVVQSVKARGSPPPFKVENGVKIRTSKGLTDPLFSKMPDILGTHRKDHVLGNIAGVVPDAL